MKMSKTPFLTRLFQDEQGATAVEYGLICAMIVLAMITALSSVANENNKKWGVVDAAMQSAAS
jgi:pilus assembly protein Flp/PilA